MPRTERLERLATNRTGLLQRVERAARAAGRDPGEVRVVAVTKSVPPAVALDLARLGSLDLGENRAPEFERKVTFFGDQPEKVRWHFIGHVQRNKARRVFERADVLHSVDSVRLLDTLERLAEETGRRPGVFLQVKLSDEDTKGGLSAGELDGAVGQASVGPLPLLGLMGLAPRTGAARPAFDRLARLAADLPAERFAEGRPRLSMGMTGDFEEAVAAGATDLRLGSGYFAGLEPELDAWEQDLRGENE